MIVYISIFLYFFVCLLKNTKLNKQYYIFHQILMILFLAFSYKMGTDWIHYQRLYMNIEIINNFLEKRMEIGYLLYNFLIKKFFDFNYEIFMGITLAICIFILLKELKKRSINFYLSSYIYLILYLFNACVEPVVRQLIATMIIISGLKYIEKKNFIKFLIFIIIATQFHKSAFIFILLYYLDKVEISLKKSIILIIFFIILIQEFENIYKVLAMIFPFLNEYGNYFGSIRYGVKKISIFLILKNILISGAYLYIIFFSYDYLLQKKTYIKNAAILSCILINLQYKLQILYRVQNYLAFFLAIVLSSIGYVRFFNSKKIINIKRKPNIILPILLLIYFGILFFKNTANTELNKYRYMQYKNYIIETIRNQTSINTEQKIFIYEKTIKKMLQKENKKLKES